MTPQAALELLRPALDAERPLLRVEDIEQQLAENRGVLWMGERSAVFTSVTAYPFVNEIVAEAGPASGSLLEILAMLPRIEMWARDAGCTQAMVIAGRKGWERALSPYGYEHYSSTFRKIL